jgi:hypothetical protein
MPNGAAFARISFIGRVLEGMRGAPSLPVVADALTLSPENPGWPLTSVTAFVEIAGSTPAAPNGHLRRTLVVAARSGEGPFTN